MRWWCCGRRWFAHAHVFNGFDKGEARARGCAATVPAGANVALACVDGGKARCSRRAACAAPRGNSARAVPDGCFAHRRAARRASQRLWCAGRCLASAVPRLVPPLAHASPPPPHPPATPASWVPATAAEVARYATRAQSAPGYLNCTRQHDELQNKCSRASSTTDFAQTLRWAWAACGGAQYHRVGAISPAGTALSWWLRTTSVEADGLTLSESAAVC